MKTLERTSTIDFDLARRADRKLRRYGSDLNHVLSVIVTVRGRPSYVPDCRSAIERSLDETASIVSGEKPGNFRPVGTFLNDLHALCV